jgi:hypothetical protein
MEKIGMIEKWEDGEDTNCPFGKKDRKVGG